MNQTVHTYMRRLTFHKRARHMSTLSSAGYNGWLWKLLFISLQWERTTKQAIHEKQRQYKVFQFWSKRGHSSKGALFKGSMITVTLLWIELSQWFESKMPWKKGKNHFQLIFRPLASEMLPSLVLFLKRDEQTPPLYPSCTPFTQALKRRPTLKTWDSVKSSDDENSQLMPKAQPKLNRKSNFASDSTCACWCC